MILAVESSRNGFLLSQRIGVSPVDEILAEI
jgi:hypothetical protein